MLFRVSTARVEESGSFSDFTGYDRTLVNIGPGNMRLTIGGETPRDLCALETVHFSGASSTHCEVITPCEDLNVFCKDDRFFASVIVRRLEKPEFIPVLPDSGWLIFVVSGQVCAHRPGGGELLVGSRDALVQDLGSIAVMDRLMLASASDAVCVVIAISFRRK
jgi:environmental stress-induced protein Ves